MLNPLYEPLRLTDSYWTTRRNVYIACVEAVAQADLVFAWLTGPDISGTLVELGYAAGLRQTTAHHLPKIVVCSPQYEPDLWFAYQTADGVFPDASSVTTAWDATLATISALFPEQPVHHSPAIGLLHKASETTRRRHSPEYMAFLNGPVWDGIRRDMLERADYHCQRCHASDVVLQVHHKHYRKPFGQETPADLEVLCLACHSKAGAARKRGH